MKRGLLWLALCLLLSGVAFWMARDSAIRAIVQGWRAEARFLYGIWRAPEISWPETIRLAMPDGPRLATDVYRPAGAAASLPTLLVRLPYGKRRFGEVHRLIHSFVPRGYVVVVQDMRGRWASEGVFAPWPNAEPDGVATLDWIVAQDWSDGRVGTIGCSALGESQIALARARHPAHRAMVPMGAGGGLGTAEGLHGAFGFHTGGIPALAAALGWFAHSGGKTPDRMAPVPVDHATALRTLPLRDLVANVRPDPTDFEAMLDNFEDRDWHRANGYAANDDSFAAPALFVDSWFDGSVANSFALSRVVGRDAPAHLLVAPGTHCDFGGAFARGRIGDLPVTGPELDFLSVQASFLDHHLREGRAPELPPYRVYVLREDRWLDSATWPPAGTVAEVLYLSGADLTATAGDASDRSFTSDPTDPVPSLGGAFCCTGNPDLKPGPVDQRPIEGRGDLLTFTSAPLERPMRITGQVVARLQVSTDVPDTDLVLRLTDVAPDDQSLTIQDGALRLRYRNGFDAPDLMEPGRTYPVRIALQDIAWQVPAGHRVRLHVAGSSYPHLSRNLNGGHRPQDETVPHPARVTLHMGGEDAASVTIPVLPE
ncbi:hypothetical protein CLV78_102338 [Aliiruegeria haliotis]|uniref:Xaa-Pro dipeptidyl-peptidase C-terminal domain-containing protein n=1 Tax=Aliiruegeria haliotis TaxID=1280846 RepID=A0A2T0RVF4_9RHOB|nr:CocE/NonD family hydrolase [Aliiruegeria haliotis]PRY25161.1 hypothetical protein CLV78_102338 [Aliiruegeria haliotis]